MVQEEVQLIEYVQLELFKSKTNFMTVKYADMKACF